MVTSVSYSERTLVKGRHQREGVKNSDKKMEALFMDVQKLAGVLGQNINMILPTFKEGGGQN